MIKKIRAREILDSRGIPTIELELHTEEGVFYSSVPSGVSRGQYEAVELRDEDGKGVKKAIENIEKIIFPAIGKEEFKNQKDIDELLIKLDGTKNKSRLGANAILAVSVALCRAISAKKGVPLYRYISQLSGAGPKLPHPSFNMIEGGKHAENNLAFQEFMIVPQRSTFKENLEAGLKIYKKLGEILRENFGDVKLSREGAFAPPLKSAFEALDFILEAIGGESIKIAIDAAGAKGEDYFELIKKYPLMSIEDPFSEEDYAAWASFKPGILVFGDDLIATNLERIKMAKEENLCNALIIKPNQIGTVTETLEAVKLAKSYGWKIMVSNRAGETTDNFIADLAAGIGAEFIKSGAPYPKERMAKYNRLLEIEKEI